MQKSSITLSDGTVLDSYRCGVLIVGSGAAGLNCAQRLFDAGVQDIAIVTSDLYGGTSYCSGSDKQTYYKMSVFGDTADSPVDMAQSLFNGGCMQGDIAYIEGLYSLPAFYHLVENGVPFPQNSYGAFVGYKTDHDPRQRATSAGPKTSRYMVETSLAQVKSRGIPIFDRTSVVRIVTDAQSDNRVVGVVAISEETTSQQSLGHVVFSADYVVLATGGPGEMYADSVYPAGQVGLHGPAFAAGVNGVNLGESQFGLTSIDFRWNLSGTYQQVVPSFFSKRGDGVSNNFLTGYYRDLPEMATNIFLKGYQWPFSAGRASDFGSSVVDIAVEQERAEGREVFMDFSANPFYADAELDVNLLAAEARDYILRSVAVQATPYQRLAHMNPDSIDIYSEHGIDLRDPLRVRVAFQHNNGGLWIDNQYQTNIANLFAIGEVAGAHGVARPGGSALNSGQVGGTRVAQILARRGVFSRGEDLVALSTAAESVIGESHRMLSCGTDSHSTIRTAVQQTMTSAAGFIRRPELVRSAVSSAMTLFADTEANLPGAASRDDLTTAWETRGLCRASVAYLKSIQSYIEDGGGSRGSYMIVRADDDDQSLQRGEVASLAGKLFDFRKEREADRQKRIVVSGTDFSISSEDVRPIPVDESWFETTWAEWKSGLKTVQ